MELGAACRFFNTVVFLVLLGWGGFGCGVLKKRSEPTVAPLAGEPLTPEEARAVLADEGENFLYGDGLGTAAANVGGTIAFPPYGLVVLGNSLLTMGGYESIGIEKVVPGEKGREVESVFTSITSAPGRLAAALAGKEFKDSERQAYERNARTVTGYLENPDQ